MNSIPQETPLKQCAGPCQRWLPPTTQYFHACNNVKSGVRARCKECCNEESKQRRDANPEKRQQYYQEHRDQICEKRRREYQERKAAQQAERERVGQPVIVHHINPTDLAWLAGLIEGEGSFSHHVTRRIRQYHDLNIKVTMADEDVIRRCLAVSGLGTVRGPYQNRNPAWKPRWIWEVTRRDDAVALMTALRPLMSIRRQVQIDACLAIHEEYPPERQGRYQLYTIETEPQAAEAADLAWLAGLIEGEGSFSHHVERKQVHSLRIRVVMSDEDVVRRCLMVSGLGTFHGPHQDMRNPAYKPTWAWQVSSREDVVALMTALRPLMGERRRSQIDECLAIHGAYPPRLPYQYQLEKTHCPQGHPYEGENLYVDRGTRYCRTCAKERRRAWYQAKRSQTPSSPAQSGQYTSSSS